MPSIRFVTSIVKPTPLLRENRGLHSLPPYFQTYIFHVRQFNIDLHPIIRILQSSSTAAVLQHSNAATSLKTGPYYGHVSPNPPFTFPYLNGLRSFTLLHLRDYRHPAQLTASTSKSTPHNGTRLRLGYTPDDSLELTEHEIERYKSQHTHHDYRGALHRPNETPQVPRALAPRSNMIPSHDT